MTIQDPDRFVKVIESGIRAEITKIIEQEIANTSKRVEERVRGEVGRIAAVVLQRFSMQRFGETLEIRVQFDTKP